MQDKFTEYLCQIMIHAIYAKMRKKVINDDIDKELTHDNSIDVSYNNMT